MLGASPLTPRSPLPEAGRGEGVDEQRMLARATPSCALTLASRVIHSREGSQEEPQRVLRGRFRSPASQLDSLQSIASRISNESATGVIGCLFVSVPKVLTTFAPGTV